MGRTHQIIKNLCKERNTSIAQMCKVLGLAPSLFSELKSGRTKNLSASTLESVAVFLGVPVDYLLDLGEPSSSDIPPEPEISDEQLMFALWGDKHQNMTKADLEQVRQFANYIEAQKNGG